MSQERRKTKNNRKDDDSFIYSQIWWLITSMKIRTISKILFYSIMGPIILYGIYYLFLHYQPYKSIKMHKQIIEVKERKPTYWVYVKNNDTKHLKHVFRVLEHLGFEVSNNESKWDLLWAYDYPFRTLTTLRNLKPHQRVNHFPGCGYITNKVDLSTSGGRYIPAAFRIPEDKDRFLQYAKMNPDKYFVQKSNNHRGIKVVKISDMNLTATGSFVQEFIDRPYLIDGYKFDIGVYTAITSIDPLRVYTYKADVLLRFCSVKYHIFDPNNVDKYVIGDDYLPIWNVPSLKNYYTHLGFSMKDSLNTYIKSQGQDPEKVWSNIHDAIREVTLMKEGLIKETMKRFGNGRNFFELVRFDFTLDEDLNVYTMEANMSPNLSSAHHPPNQLLYEQVIFNLFALIGISQRIRKDSLQIRNKLDDEMEVATKNLVVLPEFCATCEDCFRVECQLCSPCFTTETKFILSQSYKEHQNKMDYQRIFPLTIVSGMVLQNYTLKNKLLARWYQGKCALDHTWCN